MPLKASTCDSRHAILKPAEIIGLDSMRRRTWDGCHPLELESGMQPEMASP
jgi:hypothetical protein